MVAKRLLQVQIENKPAIEVIANNNGPESLIYADPPYVRSSRAGHGDAYAHEMTGSEHIELLNALKAHKGMVLLSGYENEIYSDILSDWDIRKIKERTETGQPRTECLWINPAGQEQIKKHIEQKQLSLF